MHWDILIQWVFILYDFLTILFFNYTYNIKSTKHNNVPSNENMSWTILVVNDINKD